jgi:DNA-binding beta-propeller fold protein YncE
MKQLILVCLLTLTACALGLWGCDVLPSTSQFVPANMELWVADQGLNKIHVLDLTTLQQKLEITIPAPASKPHMVVFSADFRFAYVACIGGSGYTLAIRASDYSIVATLATGASTHAAIPNWHGRQVWVAVIGERKLKEIVVDPDAQTFTLGRTLDLTQAPLNNTTEFPDNAPICHMFTYDTRAAYVTLRGGGLAVVDATTMQVVRSYPVSQIARAGCGLVNGPPGSNIMFANSGTLTSGNFYMFESQNHSLMNTMGTGADGLDAHGVAVTPDGRQLWMVNRLSDNVKVFDLQRGSFVETIANVGDAPDLMVFSPEGGRAFITLRGPNPATGTHDIRGTTPGVAVIDVATRRQSTIIPLGAANPLSDPHGIALRPLQ